jgi:hypothetical protein
MGDWTAYDRNPYRFSHPIYALQDDGLQAYIGSTFVVRGQSNSRWLIFPAHLAARGAGLSNVDKWARKIHVRPSPARPTVSIDLFSRSGKAQFKTMTFDGTVEDVAAIELPVGEFLIGGAFVDVRVIDLDAPAEEHDGEDVVAFGFPNLEEHWPPASPVFAHGKIEGKFTVHLTYGADPAGFSGAAVYTPAFSLVGMVVAAQDGRAFIIPGAYIARFVNDQLKESDRLPFEVSASHLNLQTG